MMPRQITVLVYSGKTPITATAPTVTEAIYKMQARYGWRRPIDQKLVHIVGGGNFVIH